MTSLDALAENFGAKTFLDTEEARRQARESAHRAAEVVLKNPQFCPEYRLLLANLARAYRAGADALDNKVELQQARRQIREAYGRLSQPAIRCPRCARETERCLACGLEGLYPDLERPAETDPELLTYALLALYQGVRAVGAGLVSAECLAELFELVHLELQAYAPELQERMKKALHKMEAGLQARSLSQLNRGWEELYALLKEQT